MSCSSFLFQKKRGLLCKYSAIWFQILFVVWWAIFFNTTPAFLPGLTNRLFFFKEKIHATFLHSSVANFSHAYLEWKYYSLSCKRKKKLFIYFILKKAKIILKSFLFLKFHHVLYLRKWPIPNNTGNQKNIFWLFLKAYCKWWQFTYKCKFLFELLLRDWSMIWSNSFRYG